MTEGENEVFLYLTTRGWKTAKPHQIEIWFVEHEGRYYLVAGPRYKTHWVQNILHDPAITFRVLNQSFTGTGRLIEPDKEPQLAAAITTLMDAKYEWSDGLIVELSGHPTLRQ